MVWPRTPDTPWYDNYIVLLSGTVIIVVGAGYMLLTGRADSSDAPYSDAIPSSAPRGCGR